MTRADEVRARIAAVLRLRVELIGDDVALADLAVESLALVEMAIDLQEEFKKRLGHEELARVTTIGDLIALVADAPPTGARIPHGT